MPMNYLDIPDASDISSEVTLGAHATGNIVDSHCHVVEWLDHHSVPRGHFEHTLARTRPTKLQIVRMTHIVNVMLFQIENHFQP